MSFANKAVPANTFQGAWTHVLRAQSTYDFASSCAVESTLRTCKVPPKDVLITKEEDYDLTRNSKMESSQNDDHGLPYPLESSIPGPIEPSGDQTKQGCIPDAQLRMNHIGNVNDPFAALKEMNTLLLIDDSESMKKCWDEVGHLLGIIGPICVEYDQNGLDIAFVNHRPRGYFLHRRSRYKHIGIMMGRLDMRDNVAGIYHNVKPKGKCRMDSRLASILDPYMAECESLWRQSGGKKIATPLSVIVVTDMVWDLEEDPFGTLTRTARKLDILGAPRYQVGVQLFRVGDAGRGVTEANTRYLDDGVWKEKGVRDMVDTTTWTGNPGELSPEGIVKVVLGGVRRSVDFMED